MIRRLGSATVLTAAFVLSSGAGAFADVSTTATLPVSACNDGTMTAHEDAVPETTGNGSSVFAHEAIPGTENVTPCGHDG